MRSTGSRGWVLGGCLFFAIGQWVVGQGDLPTENAQLTAELKRREAEIRSLTESLAIARTECDLFEKKWAEARLRARTLGADFNDVETAQAHRELAESIRSLYLVEADRQRLAGQLGRLIAVFEKNGDLADEVVRAKEVLATSRPVASEAMPRQMAKGSGLDAVRVLDVNGSLRIAVLNVGAADAVQVGMAFAVTRGDRVIAKVRVVEVRRRICGALIENIEEGVTVTAGDAACVTKG